MAYAKLLLILTMWREAQGEGEEGMRAVGHVVANRAMANGGSYIDAICAPNQFSSMTICGDAMTVKWPTAQQVEELADLAGAIIGGTDVDPTGGALFYANEAVITSQWYRKNVIGSGAHPVTLQLGKHVFRK
jgi:spore germination cell wall hydrolase CwlJ-like protein